MFMKVKKTIMTPRLIEIGPMYGLWQVGVHNQELQGEEEDGSSSDGDKRRRQEMVSSF